MPTFRFPGAESLRLALAAGAVPQDVADAPAAGATDASGNCWVSVPQFPRDSAVALARLGVIPEPDGVGPPLRPLLAWAELVPVRPGPSVTSSRTVIVVPDRDVPALVARLTQQGHGGPPWRFLKGRRAAVIVQSLPLHLAESLLEKSARLFGEVRPGVWVESGYVHALAVTLAGEAGWEWLIPKRGAWGRCRTPETPGEPFTAVPVGSESLSAMLPRHDVPLRLLETSTVALPTLWLAPGGPAELTRRLSDAPEVLLRKSRVAFLTATSWPEGLTVLHGEPGCDSPLADQPGAEGYTAHPQCPTVFVPNGAQTDAGAPPGGIGAGTRGRARTPDCLASWRVRFHTPQAPDLSVPKPRRRG